MQNPARRSVPLPRVIAQLFLSTSKRVYHEADLFAIYRAQHITWGDAPPRGATEFVDLLKSSGILREVKIASERYRSKRRFVRENATPFEVALSLSKGSYLSHGTAVFLHDLNDQVPKTIYVNREQTAKYHVKPVLQQDRLKNAFAGRQRTSKYEFNYESMRIVLLSGKQTGRLGVLQMIGPAGEELEATSLARTLIDIVVRPGYAGGILQVMSAYQRAVGRVSGGEMLEVLRQLDYVYPYHQSIGFLLERAGHPDQTVAPFRGCGLDLDFYLVHGMRDPEYDERWRLFYPKGL